MNYESRFHDIYFAFTFDREGRLRDSWKLSSTSKVASTIFLRPFTRVKPRLHVYFLLFLSSLPSPDFFPLRNQVPEREKNRMENQCNEAKSFVRSICSEKTPFTLSLVARNNFLRNRRKFRDRSLFFFLSFFVYRNEDAYIAIKKKKKKGKI